MAYATNDIDRACGILSDRFGIKAFRRLEGPLPAGGNIRIELAWVGTIMYELLTASGPGSEIYRHRLPEGDDFVIRHHHLGYLIHDRAAWDGLDRDAERIGRKVLSKNTTPGFLSSAFVDAPELGHLLEYIFPEQAGIDFFEGVPGN
ncbi:MAG: hypothetical protein ACLQUZ_14665 [Rhizomicrobium sp.]